MSINWKELELILSEMPLKDSFIQKVTEHNVHSFTLSLFNKEEKAWLMYTEIATEHSRVCMTDRIRKKSKTNQRFTQYLKAHIVGKKICSFRQLPFDRAFILDLKSSEEELHILFRLYSGPGANIIIFDNNNKILELLYRRPQRHESKGETLLIEERENEGERVFTVREYNDSSFNRAIDKEESNSDESKRRELYIKQIEEKRNRELEEIRESIRKQKERAKSTEFYIEIQKAADLLSSSLYLVKKGMDSITLQDWENGGTITISLEKNLSAQENLTKLYERYKKDKTTHALALNEIEKNEKRLKERELYYSFLLSEETNLERLRKEIEVSSLDKGNLKEHKCGIHLKSNGWDIIVGRNAKENDAILRLYTRGSDYWLHIRDFSGGYVIIKSQLNKTVPLPVLLDAANLAIHYSKARKNNKADIFYTQVKNLKRIKNGKTGLILPMHEKNLRVEMDEERLKLILNGRKEDNYGD